MSTSVRGQYLLLLLALIVALELQAVILPESLSMLRPSWAAMVLGFWAYRSSGVGLLLPAVLTGLCLDVLFDAALGTHAVALVAVVYAILRLRGFLSMLPLWQTALALAPVWALYSFLLFWADGATQHSSAQLARWLPVATTTLCWPLLFLVAQLLRPMRQAR